MIQAYAFDVNETLLDLKALRPAFAELIGSGDYLGEWFARMLHGSLVANHTGSYRSFGMIGVEALLVTAEKHGRDIDAEAAADFVGRMRTLPPHPDVVPTLSALSERGIRMVAFTNGSQETAEAQISNSGLGQYFESVLSIESVGKFKPAPETYLWAAIKLELDVDEVMLVAAHDWDIIGARSVGMPGAFIARPGAVWGLSDNPPEHVGQDLTVLLDNEAS